MKKLLSVDSAHYYLAVSIKPSARCYSIELGTVGRCDFLRNPL